jgi:predicted dehydrogenase
MHKVKWGVIGAGGIADRRTIPGLLEARNCELVALMDVANNDVLAGKYQLPCYATEEELLSHPGIDAVYIATPVFLHLEQIKKAARAGKHVLSEKPLCLNSRQAEEAIAACREAGVLLQEGYMMRFHGAHQKIREVICNGEIGKPVYARAQLSCWYPRMEGA